MVEGLFDSLPRILDRAAAADGTELETVRELVGRTCASVQSFAQAGSFQRSGRPRTGQVYVEPHFDHFDVRIDLPDGTRSKRKCLAPELTRDEARVEARRLKEIAWALGGARAPAVGVGGDPAATVEDRIRILVYDLGGVDELLDAIAGTFPGIAASALLSEQDP